MVPINISRKKRKCFPAIGSYLNYRNLCPKVFFQLTSFLRSELRDKLESKLHSGVIVALQINTEKKIDFFFISNKLHHLNAATEHQCF